MNFNNYQQEVSSYRYGRTFEEVASSVMKSVYLKMTFALLVTAFVSLGVAVLAPQFALLLATNSWVFWGLAIVEIGAVIYLSARLDKMSGTTASMLFYLYALLNGVTLSLIFAAYSLPSIAQTFFITAGTFGAMSVYGYFTKSDLSKIGSILYMALFGLIICIVVNLFMNSSTLDLIISGAGVLIFVGLTAWDTQKIKTMVQMNPNATDGRLATIGALTLYLDFINLFLYLLRFLGNRD